MSWNISTLTNRAKLVNNLMEVNRIYSQRTILKMLKDHDKDFDYSTLAYVLQHARVFNIVHYEKSRGMPQYKYWKKL